MEVPGLGQVTKKSSGLYSHPIPIPVLDGKQCRIVLDPDYATDPHKEEFHVAIANFLAATPQVLRDVEPELFRYYKDLEEYWVEKGNAPIKRPADIWKHIQFGEEPLVTRRPYGDRGIYISVGCNCDWEEEHGLEIILRNGLKVNKLGPHDGHLTNSDAYGDESLENVIYPRIER